MKRKMMTRFSAGCLALLLTFGSVCSVQAAQEPAEPNTGQETQTGSVTVQLTPGKEGTSVADVEFFLTKVGGGFRTVPIRYFRNMKTQRSI